MKFFNITNPNNPNINQLLKQACGAKDIEYIELDSLQTPMTKFPNTTNHLLYRVSTSIKSIYLETLMLTQLTSTFYQDITKGFPYHNPNRTEISFNRRGIPAPKTVADISNDRKVLQKYVDHLHGFPIILKALGGSHGVGVMKIESFASLISIIDFLTTNLNTTYILKEWIDTNKSARCIVLGDKVIDSIEYCSPKNDFRSNVGITPNVTAKKFPQNIEVTAIKVVRQAGLGFGGVDILIQGKKHYVSEVNFPCNFARAQMLTQVNIAGQMIDYLIKKNRNKHSKL